MISLLKQIREDLTAHGSDWTRPGFQTLAVYRLGVWNRNLQSKIARAPLHFIAKAAHVFCRNFYGIELPFSAKIGRRVVFEHQGSIVVHGNSQIGDDCILRQGCTLGIRCMQDLKAAPTLGNHVHVGAGACILGDVVVGHGSTVGANAVVTKDVENGATVVGTPAKEISRMTLPYGRWEFNAASAQVSAGKRPTAKDHGQQHMGEWQHYGPSPVDDSLKAPMIEFIPDTIVEPKWWDWRTEDDRPPGYYFWDEAGTCSYGPFEDSVAAQDAMDKYVKSLNGT